MIPGNINTDLISGADEAAYQISRSLRFNAPDGSFLSRTPASAGNRKTWTWSGWVKRSALSASTRYALFGSADAPGTSYTVLEFYNDTLRFLDTNSGGTTEARITAAVYRDTSAWMQVVLAYDTTQATASNRIKLYINGSEVTAFTTSSNPSQNSDAYLNQALPHALGSSILGSTPANYFPGYLADIHFIDGQALTPSSFAETNATTGQWVPKAYSGSYGTNGFRLDFSDNSAATATTLGKDRAGSNNWTPNNLSVTAGAGNDSLVDTPTSFGTDTGAGGEVRGNYCTLNPLDRNTNFALSNGNLDGSTGTVTWRGARGTFGVTSGKWYFECIAGSPDTMVGIADATTPITDPTFPGYTTYSYGYYGQGGVKYNNNVGTAYGSGYTTNDVIGVAFDADNGRVFFSKNGTWQASGDPAAGTNAAFTGLTGRVFFPMLATYSNVVANFGQRPFAYTAPSGFKALCDTNLPAPTIAKPSTVMDVLLWTGSSTSSGRTFSGLNFSPDFVWAKNRSGAGYSHNLYDTNRGAGKMLVSNGTDSEYTNNQFGYISAFNSDGFTTTPGSSNNSFFNELNASYVAWTWDAGSSTVTNTQGSITSQVRANASAGFSVCTFTTQSSGTGTFGHGLNVAPSLVITKARAVANNWITYHASVGNTGALLLNSTAATDTQSFYWNNTTPTATVVTLGSGFAGSNSLVAYCFAPVAGYSAFGSYTGNGSADGPFVYTGFRPRWVLLKSSSAAGESWFLLDTSRSPYNVSQEYLMPNSSAGETSAYTIMDILSNGFKLKTSGGGSAFNGSGATYIYAAFAENPFQYARAR